MNAYRPRALLLLLALSLALLTACDDGNIDALAQEAGGCPAPGPFTLDFGAAPVVNADGSLTFGASGSVRFNRPYGATSVVTACAEMSPQVAGASMYLPLLDGPASTMYVNTTFVAGGQVDVTLGDDNSGVGCPLRSFFHTGYVIGGTVRVRARLDQTGPFPVLAAWILADPASGAPPDLHSADPAYCLANSSGNWNFSTGTLARVSGMNLTVRRYGYKP